MFLSAYTESPIVGLAADELFPNINGDTFNGDVSFLAAMRALLYDRLPEGASANVVFSHVDGNDLSIYPRDETIIGRIFESKFNPETENTVYVAEISVPNARGTRDQMTEAAVKLRDEVFGSIKKVYTLGEDPLVQERYFGQFSVARLYCDPKKAITVILIFGRLTPSIWHGIAGMISRYYKRYFDDAGKPLTKWERDNIANGLIAEKRPDVFASAIYEFSKRFDFRSPMIRTGLRGFEGRNTKRRLKGLDQQIKNLMSEIESANETYARLVREKMKAEEERSMLILKDDDGAENPLMDYFLTNQNLVLKEVKDGQIVFYAKTPLRNINSDLMESLLKNSHRGDRADMYVGGPSSVTRKDRDMLFKALFVDQTISVWLYSKFILEDGENSRIHAESRFDKPIEMADCCPNPHHFYHSCMGQNQRYANDALMRGDYVFAMQQAIGATSSVNLNEGFTVKAWMDHLLKDETGRIFELPDHTRVNFSGVMEYLKAQNAPKKAPSRAKKTTTKKED